MTNDLERLGMRLVAHPKWRWVPGMRNQHERRIHTGGAYPVQTCGVCDGDERVRPDNSALAHDSIPDLSDGATRGAVLEWLRALYNDPWLFVARVGAGWAVWHFPTGDEAQSTRVALADTEADAMVDAAERWSDDRR